MPHSPELKAQIVAEWKAGSSLGELMRAHDVAKTTIRSWVAGSTRAAPKKTEALDDLSDDLVIAAFRACIAVYGQFQDKAWLSRQDADKLAVALGVSFDKLARLVGGIRARELEERTAAQLPAGAGEDR